jgi:hypothetical protein
MPNGRLVVILLIAQSNQGVYAGDKIGVYDETTNSCSQGYTFAFGAQSYTEPCGTRYNVTVTNPPNAIVTVTYAPTGASVTLPVALLYRGRALKGRPWPLGSGGTVHQGGAQPMVLHFEDSVVKAAEDPNVNAMGLTPFLTRWRTSDGRRCWPRGGRTPITTSRASRRSWRNSTMPGRAVIRLAQTMKSPPAIPEEAREHYVMAAAFVEKAKDSSGFEPAIDEYTTALLEAPWWADAYKKLAIAQKVADHYDDAIASLNLYLLTQPADARDAQDEIYKLKADKQAAADQKRKQWEEENSPQAVAARTRKDYEAWRNRVNGARYVGQSYWTPSLLHSDEFTIIGTALVWRQCIAWAARDVILDQPIGQWYEIGRMSIVGREARYHPIPAMPNYVQEIFTISEDEDHIADCDAVLKLCKAAEIFDLPEAVEYAHSAAELRASELRKYTNREGHIDAPELNPFSYRSYRDVARFYQLQAEEHTLRALEAALRTDL